MAKLNILAEDIIGESKMNNEYGWISVEEQRNPSSEGTYKCTLNDGEVYDVFGAFFANGWFWQFDRILKIKFQLKGIKPRVIAWFPNPKPYTLKGE